MSRWLEQLVLASVPILDVPRDDCGSVCKSCVLGWIRRVWGQEEWLLRRWGIFLQNFGVTRRCAYIATSCWVLSNWIVRPGCPCGSDAPLTSRAGGRANTCPCAYGQRAVSIQCAPTRAINPFFRPVQPDYVSLWALQVFNALFSS